MNFFEGGELRKLFEDGKTISSPSFPGRVCLGTLGKDLRVRAELFPTGHEDHYSAIKLTVLNRTRGEVDSLLLQFQDVWGRKPVPGNPNFPEGVMPLIWTSNGKTDWYAWAPAPADREQLLRHIRQYLEPFRDRQQERVQEGPQMVYICAPLRGDVENNIEFARQRAQEVFQAGDIPVCPHLMFPPVADPEDPAQDLAAREMGLRLVESCRQIRVCGSTVTEGMRAEIQRAQELGVPVVYEQEPPQRTRSRGRSAREGAQER